MGPLGQASGTWINLNGKLIHDDSPDSLLAKLRKSHTSNSDNSNMDAYSLNTNRADLGGS